MAANQQQQQQQLPIWIVKWPMPAKGRGRRHAAMFIPEPEYASVHPTGGETFKGTMYQVSGSPFGGFGLNIQRNWDSAGELSLENASLVGWIDQQHVHGSTTSTDYLADESHRRANLDRYASNVRPPGVTAHPWIAEEIMDCQDWLCSLVEYMVQQKVIAVEALQATRNAMDAKTPLMPAPGGAATVPGQPAGAQLITASIMPRSIAEGGAHPVSSRTHSSPSSSQPASQPRVGQSEWKVENSRFERYNYTAARWEYYDHRAWVAVT